MESELCLLLLVCEVTDFDVALTDDVEKDDVEKRTLVSTLHGPTV